MTVLGGFSCSDHWKPDSTLTNANGDRMQFHTYATIDTSAGLVFGNESLSCKMDVAKGSSLAQTAIATPTDEWCVLTFVKFVIDGTFSAPAAEYLFFSTHTTASKTVEIKFAKNGVSTTTYVLNFYYDGVKIGASQVITLGTVYRIGIYVKKGATGTGDCTYKVYLDDMTAGMTDTFVATNVISTTTATFTNAPSTATIIQCGNSSGGLGLGNTIIKFGHASMIDTAAGGTFTDPVNRVTQPIVWSKKSAPVTVDASYNDWPTVVGTGDMADNASGPDDATSYIGCTIIVGSADKFTLWSVTPWATVGHTNGDEIGTVRVSGRMAGNLGTNGTATLASGMREGGTNVISLNTSGTWTSKLAGTPQGIALQMTPPGSGGNWSPTLYNGVEMGARCAFGAFGGTDTKSGLTWLRADALFRMKAASSAVSRRRMAQWG